jgi:hypothetical protein
MPMLGLSDSPEARREIDGVYRWLLRALSWTIVTGGIFAAVAFALYGPYGQPSGVPAWIVILISGAVGLPGVAMLVVAAVYLVRAGRARQRDIKAGWVVHTNRFAAWADYHGIAVGLAVVAIVVAVTIWLSNHGVKLGRGS